ncbi:MAG TPA: methyltransferase [Eudoraea sp.]|nr:methyltransferase [Eudoraea sp.]
MKVGTDGVLLGAWAPLEHQPGAILDIGAGTGLIALMMAQRSGAKTIDAIEIDNDAYEQCVENFEASSWADRLFCYHAGLEEFAGEMEIQYDLIVSNPPYFSSPRSDATGGGARPTSNSRIMARSRESLPFGQLLKSVATLLSPQGRFATIIPYPEEEPFLHVAAMNHIFPASLCRVRGNTDSPWKRSLMVLSPLKRDVTHGALTIEIKRHQYTEAYIGLTKEFYLDM